MADTTLQERVTKLPAFLTWEHVQGISAKLDRLIYQTEGLGTAQADLMHTAKDHEVRIRNLEIAGGSNKGTSELVRWALPVLLSIANLGFAALTIFLK